MLSTNIGAMVYEQVKELKLEVKKLKELVSKLKGEIRLRDKILKQFTAGLPVDYSEFSEEDDVHVNRS